ncbi:acyl-CoA-binding protein (ACBP)/diazepam binding inhibitor (DBI)/endozepine (EP) [Friedmanniomyces endolithicus]|uniref:Acyl-CoA-binding protein (ACBP)/diazepam binding inhibitor (DBI)/endozepine (EP) n=1 Tax=Friedmanniomyces endolithicus TaxID=329885 RepID=A0A4U0V695_9PEZI|nr:acyl-CoA-binding protein (ACBP)/diazepam binding inhibitor (DBI)/endozepine (EP) [Friedmanniomyces endolithicus]KAK0289083.1 acyl-CoA-binding protein (ACBP)/diazepam binding inhibitor (DBI)/endozepine (EP) [Friedmanniomyces endolithicus]KAK0293851.1 acyl-CoA-binding protein (ACBP)/diazepam binding inhibitor (DBI)/endozepine (EP) [Friedmanniomyces endolithicus]KAK0324365.1 acyl-CoA-binding protein (ACBP)/diazepam binding inhibitor (DBI)/endozepine (EP) [Friedmanniomyces endolithicus]KAK099171
MAPQTAEFKKAVADSRKLKAKPTDTELLEVRMPNIPPMTPGNTQPELTIDLQLYGLFKQGTQDPPFEQTKAPGMFEIKEKAKRGAWEKLVKDGVTPADAQKKYVALVMSLKAKHGYTP